MDHYNIPLWAKIKHSAIWLYESIGHSATNLLLTNTDEKVCHRETHSWLVDLYARSPKSGEYSLQLENTWVFSILKFGKNKSRTRTRTRPEKSHFLSFPTYFLARFILAFFDIAPPAMNNVQQEGQANPLPMLHVWFHNHDSRRSKWTRKNAANCLGWQEITKFASTCLNTMDQNFKCSNRSTTCTWRLTTIRINLTKKNYNFFHTRPWK